MRTAICVLVLLTLAGCTDAERAFLSAYGEPGTVRCFSGGQVIYDGQSTGKIASTANSDGWEFKDAKSGRFVRVSGDCVVTN